MRKLGISALVLCLLLCLGACVQVGSFKVNATPSPVPTATPEAVVPTFTGEGTEEDPYRISTAEELKLLSQAVQPWNPQYWEYQNAHYRLEGDIVLNEDADFENWESSPPENLWTPIHTIAGSFDGNGHTIRGLYCKGGEDCGLFKNISGRVFDLTLENAFIDGRQETKAGGTLAAAISGTVVNCKSSGTVLGGESILDSIGGMAGHNYGTMTDCTFVGKLFSTGSTLGGMAGTGNNFINCHVNGQIVCEEEDSAHAGGIVGGFSASMKDCGIENCTFSGEILSGGVGGGILGVNSMRNSTVIVENCRSEGDLIFTKERVMDAATLSGTIFTMSRVSGGIVGYAGNYPLLTARISERKLDNINVENAAMEIQNCTFTGRFVQPAFRFAEDVTEELLKKWEDAGYIVENFYIALEGGVLGTIGDERGYSVKISDCTYPHAERAMDDSLRLPDKKEG